MTKEQKTNLEQYIDGLEDVILSCDKKSESYRMYRMKLAGIKDTLHMLGKYVINVDGKTLIKNYKN